MTHGQQITVIVTGGAIDAGIDFNSSGMIRDSLPEVIHRPGRPPIKILRYPHGTICSYAATRALIPKLWQGQVDDSKFERKVDEELTVDLMLHMGMRTSSDSFCLETQARRDCYNKPGEDGVYLHQAERANGPSGWDDLPTILFPDLDVSSLRDRIAQESPNINIEVSNNAGGYFCEFEFYSSLAELHKRGEFARVMFLHTPASKEEVNIRSGVHVVSKLVCAALESIDK